MPCLIIFDAQQKLLPYLWLLMHVGQQLSCNVFQASQLQLSQVFLWQGQQLHREIHFSAGDTILECCPQFPFFYKFSIWVSNFYSCPFYKSSKFKKYIIIQAMCTYYNLTRVNTEALKVLGNLPPDQKYRNLADILKQIKRTGDENLMMLEDNLEQCDENVFGYLKIMEIIKCRRSHFYESQFVLTKQQRDVREKARQKKRLKRSGKSCQSKQMNLWRFLPELIITLLLVIVNLIGFYRVSLLQIILSLGCAYLFQRLGETNKKISLLEAKLAQMRESSDKKFQQIVDQAKKLKPIQEAQNDGICTTQN